LKLILRLLLIVHASLYRCVHAGVRIECGSAVDAATSFNIKLWNIVRDGDDQLRSEDDNWKQNLHFSSEAC